MACPKFADGLVSEAVYRYMRVATEDWIMTS